MAVGALVAPTSWGALLWLASGLLTALLCIVLYTPIVRGFVPTFVRADTASVVPVDAIVVLSGTVTDDGRLTGQALDRLLTALSVAKHRAISNLAVSVLQLPNRPTSQADQRELAALIDPELAVHFVRDVHSTHDEALAFAAMARTRDWHRVIVVTSLTHTRRACGAIEATGLVVECVPAEPRDYALRGLDRAGPRRLAFQEVVYETLGTALYRWRGWMR